ncbi:MAG TPA: hypothetical protein VMV46_20800 [Thermoanaerobaculia bacterium]|nr:hypothetical protein [Thermoanaerobaculia bacterium]
MPEGLVVVSVPAVVTVRSATFHGTPAGEIRAIEEPVPLGTRVVGSADDRLAKARALLAWRGGEPLPGIDPLVPVPADREPGRTPAFARVENGTLLLRRGDETAVRIEVSALFPQDATDPGAAYDAATGRFLAFALTDGGGRPHLPLLLAVTQGLDPIGSWHRISLGRPEAATLSPATLELVAHDEEALYLLTSSPASGEGGSRSIWIVPKGLRAGFYGGGETAVTLVRP